MIALLWFFLTLFASPFKSRSRLEAENAALRHQLIVLQRKVRGRVHFTNSDRLFFVQLYRWFPSVLKAMTISWGTFLRNHAPHIAAMDLFVVPTIGFNLLYVLVIVRVARRELVWINVTPHPTAEWIAQQITEAFPWDKAPCYLIRDRDGTYGAAVTRRLRAMGIRDKPIAPGSPWQNCFAERLIGSIRRECVDHIVALGEQHLRQVMKSYAGYYNTARTHRSLDKDAPLMRPVQRIGRIVSHALIGGLHHQYVRI